MSDNKIVISVRISPDLLAAVEKYVNAHKPEIRDRTQAIEVALARLIKPPRK